MPRSPRPACALSAYDDGTALFLLVTADASPGLSRSLPPLFWPCRAYAVQTAAHRPFPLVRAHVPPAFQAGHAGSIPVARSRGNAGWPARMQGPGVVTLAEFSHEIGLLD